MPKFINRWRNAWRIRFFRDQFFVSIAGLLVVLVVTLLFLDYVERRSGSMLEDPLLSLLSPVDLKWITFSLVYSGVLLGFVSLGLYPFNFLLAIRAFFVMMLLRITCLFFLPLDPPAGFIPLIDPFVQLAGMAPVFTRDLFFSWHTATIALFAFTVQWKDMKIIFSCTAGVVSALLLLQHAHYTIDVIAAPCFAYVAYGIARWMTIENVAELQSSNRSDKARG
jgi:hypothetical protein